MLFRSAPYYQAQEFSPTATNTWTSDGVQRGGGGGGTDDGSGPWDDPKADTYGTAYATAEPDMMAQGTPATASFTGGVPYGYDGGYMSPDMRTRQDAIYGAQNAMFYTPGEVQAQQASATANLTPEQVAAQTGAGGMAAYQNPYQQQVIDQGVDDIMRAAQITDQYRNQSGSAGTYGGDRQAIREAEFDRGVSENVSRFVNQARSQGFDTAAGLAQADANRFLQAGGMNQAAGLQAGLANQQALNNMARFNSNLGLQAQLANQQAGLSGAGLNLSGAGAMGGLANDQLQGMLSGVSALNQFGTQQQATNQAAIDADMRQWYEAQNAGLRDIGTLQGILQGMPVGMNTTTYQPGGSALSGILGGGIGLLGSLATGGAFGAGGLFG